MMMMMYTMFFILKIIIYFSFKHVSNTNHGVHLQFSGGADGRMSASGIVLVYWL